MTHGARQTHPCVQRGPPKTRWSSSGPRTGSRPTRWLATGRRGTGRSRSTAGGPRADDQLPDFQRGGVQIHIENHSTLPVTDVRLVDITGDDPSWTWRLNPNVVGGRLLRDLLQPGHRPHPPYPCGRVGLPAAAMETACTPRHHPRRSGLTVEPFIPEVAITATWPRRTTASSGVTLLELSTCAGYAVRPAKTQYQAAWPPR